MAARARAARFQSLERACARAGIVHLLLGHHAADQAETVALRLLEGSGLAGLAGMAALVERREMRILRPLLGVPGGRLRAELEEAGVGWIEDPSNRDPGARRNRLRLLRGDADGAAPVTRAAVEAARLRGEARLAAEVGVAAWLAARVALRPEGFAVVSPGPMCADGVAAVLRVVAGRSYPPAVAAVAGWAAAPRAATLGGAEIRAGGRLAPGHWLVLREAAAMAGAVVPGVCWDGRFRLVGGGLPAGVMLGPLGGAATGLRMLSPLPAAVLRTMPALWRDGLLFAVPHLGYGVNIDEYGAKLVFEPASPAAGAGFLPMRAGEIA